MGKEGGVGGGAGTGILEFSEIGGYTKLGGGLFLKWGILTSLETLNALQCLF